MATKFCKWPVENLAGAQAYNAACQTAFRTLTGEPDGIWAVIRQDKNGNHTVPLLGPPWFYMVANDFAEPPACLALRVDAVVVDAPEWPVIED